MRKHKAIKAPDNTCLKCLKEFEGELLHKYMIDPLGYGSSFDGWGTKVNLCNNCISYTNLDWWKLRVVQFDYQEKYEYEDEIISFIKSCPIEGQELFWNRFSYGITFPMKPQDWIDYRLNALSHEKCKEYGLISPDEVQAYLERYPICKHVKVKPDKYSRCKFGATGMPDGSTCSPSTECYNCEHFEIRSNPDTNAKTKDDEVLRLEKQIRILQDELEKLKNQ